MEGDESAGQRRRRQEPVPRLDADPVGVAKGAERLGPERRVDECGQVVDIGSGHRVSGAEKLDVEPPGGEPLCDGTEHRVFRLADEADAVHTATSQRSDKKVAQNRTTEAPCSEVNA